MWDNLRAKRGKIFPLMGIDELLMFDCLVPNNLVLFNIPGTD